MKKSLVMFLVATLLLAGCTELLDSGDGETKNIEVNEDIALEKIDDFMTVDEGESFGITMMYDMDPAMMGMDEACSKHWRFRGCHHNGNDRGMVA
jgi:hypothetical protein